MRLTEHRIDPRRFRAIAILRYGTVDALHKRLPMSGRAIAAHVARGALPPSLAHALHTELGETAWRFVIGHSDTLTETGGAYG
jgi:hypothetical protein